MKLSYTFLAFFVTVGVAACNQQDSESAESSEPTDIIEEQAVSEDSTTEVEVVEIAPGLSAKIVQRGYCRAAEAGDFVEVHYTGWLYDEQAEDHRGDKFDSSVDRGQKFHFKLGEGQVIKGWDQGVAGMLIGEKRVLTLSPDMGYGERGAGGAIPPGATLVFEIELFGLEGPND